MFDVLGYHRVALLYPNVSTGVDLANLLWDEVEARKGEVRGVESFDYDQTTFMTPVKRLVGRAPQYLDARPDYVHALQDIVKDKTLTPTRRQKEIESLVKSLPPVTDFDALFIPGNAKQVGFIAPALAFEDIIVSTDKEELKKIMKSTGRDDITPVRLVGANGWNSPQTAERGGKFVEGAVFTDGFFVNDADPRVQKFVKEFRELNGHSDPELPDAQAYDAAGIVRAALNHKPADRVAMKDIIAATANYPGVTGKIHFDAVGEAQKELYVLTIEHGEIVKFDAGKVAQALSPSRD
jgi:hypothetical protein